MGWLQLHKLTYTYACAHTHTHVVVAPDNRMVSRCYRGKTRCTEFTRYPTVVKMLKQQLSAFRSYPPATSGYVYTYVCAGVYNWTVEDLDYTKLWLPWRWPDKNTSSFLNDRAKNSELLYFFHENHNSQFDTSSLKFIVSKRDEWIKNVKKSFSHKNHWHSLFL